MDYFRPGAPPPPPLPTLRWRAVLALIVVLAAILGAMIFAGCAGASPYAAEAAAIAKTHQEFHALLTDALADASKRDSPLVQRALLAASESEGRALEELRAALEGIPLDNAPDLPDVALPQTHPEVGNGPE